MSTRENAHQDLIAYIHHCGGVQYVVRGLSSSTSLELDQQMEWQVPDACQTRTRSPNSLQIMVNEGKLVQSAAIEPPLCQAKGTQSFTYLLAITHILPGQYPPHMEQW